MDHYENGRRHYEEEHMSDRTTRRSDLILHSNEFAHIGDQTTGQIITYVGPMKTSLQNTEMPKIFDPVKKVFKDETLENAIQTMITAPTGWYVILKNPAPGDEWPKTGKANDPTELKIGVKVNIPGPCNWPLWPGQMHRLVEGHRLRTNHYLMCRVYDAKAAMANWETAVVEKQKEETIAQTSDSDSVDYTDLPDGAETADIEVSGESTPAVLKAAEEIPELSNGQRIIVKGTDVSFFIPPTGLEVVPEEITKNHKAKYIRNALTLENLEYCILLDEDGNTRYVRGPQVVFPTPTERFLKDNEGNKKWRALELNEITGIYTKVIKSYTDPDTGEDFEVGERFITGKQMKFYFPRAEEEIITYQSSTGSKLDRHFAVAIPEGDGRYILDRGCRNDGINGGKVSIVEGPKMYLADPRYEVFVRRVLTVTQCELWFPGNREVIDYNQALKGITKKGDDFVSENVYQTMAKQYLNEPLSRSMMKSFKSFSDLVEPEMATTIKKSEEKIVGSSVDRRDTFTKPREIELDTKFQGVVSLDIWPGYAVQVVSKTNKRETVVGPVTRKLEFSETLMPMEVSTGKPKNTDHLKKFVYLKVHANKISDIIEDIETSDLYKFDVKLSYRVNFLEKHEEHPDVNFKDRWFSVENYVKFLADNCRSRVKALMKQHDVEQVYANGLAMVRDMILGPQSVDEDTGEATRPLLFFEENGMLIYDVEVLALRIHDTELTDMLSNMKRTIMKNNLKVKASESNLAASSKVEQINRQISDQERETLENTEQNNRLKATALNETELHEVAMNMKLDAKRFDRRLAEILADLEQDYASTEGRVKKEEISRTSQVDAQKDLDEIARGELERSKARTIERLEALRGEMEIRIEEAEKLAEADATKLRAINEKMVGAIEQLAAASTFAAASDSLAPLSIIKGTSLAGVMTEMLEGTMIGDKLKQLMPQPTTRQYEDD